MQRPASRTYKTTVQGLSAGYDSWKIEKLPLRRFQPEFFHQVIDEITDTSKKSLHKEEIGTSFEGRPIRLISAGSGRTKVLLWSQMHGDESTATMAIADILNYFALQRGKEDANIPSSFNLLSSLHLLFLPMLNPDGAARFQRRSAQGIDMNRDALALQTPEARILKEVQQKHQPTFSLNLHDQELSTVGTSKELTALAVLAPAFDEGKSDNEVRIRAKRLAATFVSNMNQFVPGKIARYDDAFEPLAFGDNMQRWGTSTILIESGHTRDDPEKHFIRQLNAIGILSALYAIATEEYASADLSLYESLPYNGKKAYDLIIRQTRIKHTNGAITHADLGISYQVDTHTEDTPVLADLGDLRTFIGLREFDAHGTLISADVLILGKPFHWQRVFNR